MLSTQLQHVNPCKQSNNIFLGKTFFKVGYEVDYCQNIK